MSTRILGMGASAGGLAPLEAFLAKVPHNSGLAYVVVQHLDPTHKALLPNLLQRVTSMPVREATQGMPVEPDCVYVIPPNTEIRVADGHLNLAEPMETRGMRLPVDVLFSSLASARGDQAIGVVFSGMGADGTQGLQAIKAVGGLTAVQQPDTAQFDAMPKSAIAAQCVDLIAPPDDLPARILSCIAQTPDIGAADEPSTEPESDELTPVQRILRLLQARTRHDFSLYKSSTLNRRMERRMAIHGIENLSEYAEFLERNSQEVDLLFKEVLIGVTRFFRDAPVWQYLADTTLPELLAQPDREPNVRAWVVGCSTGEEAYSLAIIFTEALDRLPKPHNVTFQIFATDLSPDAIATARRGFYPADIRDTVSPDRLARFFSVEGDGYLINRDIRDRVLFALHNVVLDPPFTRLDLISCRNLLIYFDQSLQRKLMPLFHYSLRTEGVLLLGSSETVGRYDKLFTASQFKLRLFQRKDNTRVGNSRLPVESFPPLSWIAKELPVSTPHQSPPTHDNLQTAADQVLLQVFAPAAVVVNDEGDIVYISGRTGKYLEPATGKANLNFHAMVREDLRLPIGSALRQAAKQSEPFHLQGLQVQLPGGVIQRVDVTLQALQEPSALRGMKMIVFRDVAPAKADAEGQRKSTTVQQSHTEEQRQWQDEIQALREENRVSREELQAANEELQSTNEELQSTNEELTTSKEEMQSMNEELQTINAEMQAKLDDLALAQSDMTNLLNSIDIAILFLDQNLNLRRFTDRASKIISIRESDMGRPLSDFTTILEYPDLNDDARATLKTLAFSEKQITATDGRWFNVRIMPYRRLDNVIDGVVITLVDISETKRMELALRADLEP